MTKEYTNINIKITGLLKETVSPEYNDWYNWIGFMQAVFQNNCIVA
jgi:hypothetical protein